MRILSAIAFLMILSACSSVKITDYKNESPTLRLEDYFNGTVDGWGIVQERSGKVASRFHVVMNCTWKGDEGVFDEDFTYANGKKEKRVWKIKKLPDGKYTGTAGDVIGEAAGEVSGNAFQWNYVLRLPVDDTTYDMSLDDWMWQLDGQRLMNRTKIKKFGITFAEVSIFFEKRSKPPKGP